MPCHGSSLSAAQIEPQSSGKALALLLSTAWRRRPRRTHRSPVAQLVEQAAVNRWVAGSSPARGAKSSKHLAKNQINIKADRATLGATFYKFRSNGQCAQRPRDTA